MKLLPSRLDDFNDLVQLDAEAGPHPWSVVALQQALRESRVWRLEHNGELAGFLVGESVLDESSLLHLAIARVFQGRGLARQALQQWLVQLHRLGQQRCVLEVRPSNDPAVALYHRLGFEPIGQRRRYYADGEDAMVMAAELGGG